MANEFLVEISARHVHVTKETLEVLFGKGYELTVKKELSQPGQFASNERVTVVGPKKELAGVSILGPCRSADQVELSATDARSVGIAAPIRESGDVKGSGACKLVGPAGEVELKEGVIVAKRHIHMTPEDADTVRRVLEDARMLQRATAPKEEEAAGEENQAVEDTAYFRMRQRIAELLSVLPQEDAKLLTLRYGLEKGLPMTPEETGKALGLTVDQVVQREAKALSLLREEK